jgi:hypothetical protein
VAARSAVTRPYDSTTDRSARAESRLRGRVTRRGAAQAALEVATRPADDYRRALATYALAGAADALGRSAEARGLRRHAAELRARTRTPPLRVAERLLRARHMGPLIREHGPGTGG